MANPTQSFVPAVNAFQAAGNLSVGLHEQADGTFVNISPAAPLPVLSALATTVASATVTVTTAGIRVQLATTTVKSVVVKATAANTGIIYVGTSTVAAANGYPLAAGESVTLEVANTDAI